MAWLLKDKTVLITGASKGLGFALAHAFWSQAANLILVARSQQALESLATTLKSQEIVPGQKITIVAADIMQFPYDLLQDTQIDVLVNNAAIQGPIGTFDENDWQVWQEAIEIDLLAPAKLIHWLLPQMKARRAGKIINLSGGGATGCRPNFSAYAVAKIGLVKLTETVAKEVEEYGINVNAVAPGVMPTAMLEEVLRAGQASAGIREYDIAAKATESNAECNASSMEQAVKLCTYLASEESNGVTGKIISAVWDNWPQLHKYINELSQTDIYTLRRIVPKDRGFNLGEK